MSKWSPRLDRISASLDRMDLILAEHPEIRERTAQHLAGELPALKAEVDMGERTQTSLWIEADLLERADKLIGRLAASPAGELMGNVTRSDVIRLALKRGLEALETELPKAKRKRRKAAKR